ncbi:restriction endonuclease subunit S [Paenibacillus donghaensis]|uniref:Restriction endonuclease subunit S n=1 Tax=Paenibacillus donghaensis TaxID=414771 RepID=A0A2Z2KYM7_9BACL|nr:restriction endonuclease subunit S [Paenibacillus donghaensis]ASA25668.1 restriction endonuclease subunit S [Paenibacillus donghaensis]
MSMPALRFDFDFDSDWNETPLSTLLTFNNGINASKDSYGHGRKFINVLDILNNEYILYDDVIGSVSVSERQEEVSKVEYGDMLFLRSSETREDVGKSSTYLDKNEYALFGGFVIRGKKVGEYNPYFLKLLLDTSSARDQVSSKAGGSTRYNVSQTILNSVSLYMPSLEEQHKIATFFSLLDQKIVKQQEKIKQLEQFKKGMMKKIFSQEIRFKDKNGQEFPEWEERYLGDIVETFSGGTPTSTNSNFYNGDIPFIRSAEINSNSTELRINKTGLNNSSAKMIRVGDLLVALYGANSGDTAISKLEGAINQAILCIRSKHDTKFIKLFLDNNKQNILSTYLQGGQGNLSANIIKKLIIHIPSLEEQHKIASNLSLIGSKIEKEFEKQTSLIELKKGLMQKMFV